MRLFKSKMSKESVVKQKGILNSINELLERRVSHDTSMKVVTTTGMSTFMLTMSPNMGLPVSIGLPISLIGCGALLVVMDFDKPIYAGIKKLLENSKDYIQERSGRKSKIDFDKINLPEDLENKQPTDINPKQKTELSSVDEMADNMLSFYLKKKEVSAQKEKVTIKPQKP